MVVCVCGEGIYIWERGEGGDEDRWKDDLEGGLIERFR